MKISDYIVDFLAKKNIDTIFGYQGGMVTHIAHSIHEHKNMRFVQVYHEQTAAFAAVGYARHTNNVGVAIATSGPGATNMITGIADAFFDSIPTIFITGQVNTHEYKYDKPIKQLGFQETNIVEILKPITKYIKLVDKAEDIPAELEQCFNIATSGRKGPVLLDIPMNVQREILKFNTDITKYEAPIPVNNITEIQLVDFLSLIKNSQRPLILVGGGVYSADAIKECREFIELTQIPFVSSLLGKNGCDEYSELYVGTIGSYGNRCANMAIANSDLLIVLGARLDVRQTGSVVNKFVPQGKIIQVDIDVNELDFSRINTYLKIHSDIKLFLSKILKMSIDVDKDDLLKWFGYLNILKTKFNQVSEVNNIKKPAPYNLINFLNKVSNNEDIFCADVGQNQMWVMQMLKLKPEQRFFTSGGLGSMGSALPISVGIAFAQRMNNKHSTIFSINGDGGAHMAIQSLMLIKQYNLPIKVIIINNHALGMITQFQELYFDNVTTGTTYEGGYQVPDFSNIAAAYGLEYYKVDMRNGKTFDSSEFSDFLNCRNCILEYVIDSDSRVNPKLEFNQPIYNPSPNLTKDELIKNMLINVEI